MIGIINISEDQGIPYGKGHQVYKLMINRELIGLFNHTFENGLAACLRAAADMVDSQS